VAALVAAALLHLGYAALPRALAAATWAWPPPWLVVLVLPLCVGEVIHNATYSLVDVVTFLALPDRLLYGRIRLWAGLLFAVSSLAMGCAVELPGFSLGLIFVVYAAVLLLAAALWTFAPPPLLREVDVTPGEGSCRVEGAAAEPYARRLCRFAAACDTRLAELMVVIFGMGVANACMNAYVFLLIDDLGGSTFLMGLSIVLNIVTEVPIFQYSGQLITRLGARGVIYVGAAAHVLRLAGYAVAWSPWSVLIVEPLHGVTFALVWSNLATIGAAISPAGLEATTQGVLNGVFNGLGGVTGMLAGGVLYDRSPKLMFGSVAVLILCTMALMLWADLRRRAGARASGARGLLQSGAC